MVKKSYQDHRSSLLVDTLISDNFAVFENIPDHRNRVINQSMGDVCQSAVAMFHLKFPSLLDFDSATSVQKENIQSVYGIKSLCSDTQMRRILDQVPAHHVHDRITELITKEFTKVGGVRQYQIFDQRLIISLDGVEHFRSGKVNCENSLQKTSSKNGISYYH